MAQVSVVKSKPLLFITALTLLTGCQSTQEWLATKPLQYQKGYTQGCTKGEEVAQSFVELEAEKPSAYTAIREFKLGWDDGYNDCYEDKKFEIMSRRAR